MPGKILCEARGLARSRLHGIKRWIGLMAMAFTTIMPTSAATAQPVATIDSGKLAGVAVNEAIVAFKGIPYAAAPVGPLRWRAPQSAPLWTGTRPATDFGAICPQTPFPGGPVPANAPQAEDCLFLNVWMPATALRPDGSRRSAGLPVLVSIHGGGLVNGSGSDPVFDGGALARRGIIVVTFNYRLGRLGFFRHPALTAENADATLGNYGFMDQIAALQWVRRNIARFGGDPARVTIAGESAGAVSVQTMMISPLARGLFAAAIAQSSAPRIDFASSTAAELAGSAFAAGAGVPGNDLKALREIPIPQLLKDAEFFKQDRKTYSGAMVDGTLVPELLMTAFAAGHQAKVPYIGGANGRELGGLPGFAVTALVAQLPSPAQALMKQVYDPGGDRPATDFGIDFLSDQALVEPARTLVKATAKAGQPSWTYRFDYVAEHLRATTPGATHASDVAYTFATIGKVDPMASDADRRVADMVADYWANFVRTHDPNGPGLPAWPRANAGGDPILLIGNMGIAAGPDPRAARLDALAEFTEPK